MKSDLKTENFEIIEAIGSGGMGDVYLATDRRLQRTVALKVLKSNEGKEFSVEDIKRFLSEAKSIAQINHPNIVTIYDILKPNDLNTYPMIVMEHLVGEDLKQFVKTKSLNVCFFIELLRDLARAFKAVHQKNIIHRDIKPSNIFITRDGIVKILDFGIAKWNEDPDCVETQTNQFVGSVYFTAPEVLSFSRQSIASDIYSLGLTVLSSIVGKIPINGESFFEIAESIKYDEIRLNEALEKKFPPKFLALLYEMIEKHPDDRPQSMQQIFERCQEVLTSNDLEDKHLLDQDIENLDASDTLELFNISFTKIEATTKAPIEKKTARTHYALVASILILLGIAGGGSYYFVGNESNQNIPKVSIQKFEVSNDLIKQSLAYLGDDEESMQFKERLIEIDKFLSEHKDNPRAQNIIDTALPSLPNLAKTNRKVWLRLKIGAIEVGISNIKNNKEPRVDINRIPSQFRPANGETNEKK